MKINRRNLLLGIPAAAVAAFIGKPKAPKVASDTLLNLMNRNEIQEVMTFNRELSTGLPPTMGGLDRKS